jgi:hypothetical protein
VSHTIDEGSTDTTIIEIFRSLLLNQQETIRSSPIPIDIIFKEHLPQQQLFGVEHSVLPWLISFEIEEIGTLELPHIIETLLSLQGRVSDWIEQQCLHQLLA